MSNTVRTAVVNKNGVLTHVHKNPDDGTKNPSRLESLSEPKVASKAADESSVKLAARSAVIQMLLQPEFGMHFVVEHMELLGIENTVENAEAVTNAIYADAIKMADGLIDGLPEDIRVLYKN